MWLSFCLPQVLSLTWNCVNKEIVKYFLPEIYLNRTQFELFSRLNKSRESCLTRRWTKPLRGGGEEAHDIARGKDIPVIVREVERKRLKLMC